MDDVFRGVTLRAEMMEKNQFITISKEEKHSGGGCESDDCKIKIIIDDGSHFARRRRLL